MRDLPEGSRKSTDHFRKFCFRVPYYFCPSALWSPVKLPIYLDYNATTPVDPRVVERMLPYFTTWFGNAASRNHSFGWTAERAVETARDQVATLLQVPSQELVWTSGATESCNTALFGAAARWRHRGRHLISTPIEHKAVLDPLRKLEEQGWEVTYLSVDADGQIDLQELKQTLRPDTVLVSLMAAHNELGTLYPLAEATELAHQAGALVHTDATQAVGKVPLNLQEVPVDLLSFSAHKFYGPKGVGGLRVRRVAGAPCIDPLLLGGGHEAGLRSGTLNVPGIMGMGKAAELCAAEQEAEGTRQRKLLEQAQATLTEQLDGVLLNGPASARLPNTLNVSFTGVDGEALLLGISELAVASGSACTSADISPSYVLQAIGRSEALARASLRLSIGRMTTAEEVAYATRRIIETVQRLRASG